MEENYSYPLVSPRSWFQGPLEDTKNNGCLSPLHKMTQHFLITYYTYPLGCFKSSLDLTIPNTLQILLNSCYTALFFIAVLLFTTVSSFFQILSICYWLTLRCGTCGYEGLMVYKCKPVLK